MAINSLTFAEIPRFTDSLDLALQDTVDAVDLVVLAEEVLIAHGDVRLLRARIEEETVHVEETPPSRAFEDVKLADHQNSRVCLLPLVVIENALEVVLGKHGGDDCRADGLASSVSLADYLAL